MRIHDEPRLCLRNLVQQASDGGRAEYQEQERRSYGSEPEMPTGDCAVVAVVHATFRSLTGQSYRQAKNELSTSIWPWMQDRRRKGEGQLGYRVRRIKQWVQPPKPNPIHGTPSDATGLTLALWGYRHIYPNEVDRWYCICDMECTYVLDVQIPSDHTMAVHQGVAYTTAFFDPDEAEVGNVLGLDPGRTKDLKANAQYKRDDELWFKTQMANGDFELVDWKTRPEVGGLPLKSDGQA